VSVQATGQPVAGVLWYQGESDTSAESASAYTEKMKALVAAVRRDLRQPRLPWLMVQLARVFRIGTGEHWNRVQEQQRVLPDVIPCLETVAAIDLSLDDEIHIGAVEMPRLGARLAQAARSLSAKNKTTVRVPRLRAVTWERSTEKKPDEKCLVEVSFDSVVGGLRADGEPSGFSLIDPSGVELPWIFKIKLRENTARLHLMRQPPPGSMIAYGRGFGPRCNLTDGRDLAMPVFAGQLIGGNEGLQPFVTTWRVHPLVETTAFIDEVKKPSLDSGEAVTKTYSDGFINEHTAWQGRSGHAFFETTVEFDQARTIELLMGYDGPFRLWINGRSFFCNAAGANPCLPDENAKRITLPAGRHEFIVGMDIAHGRTWGFFLRWRDVKARL
ncbi:MAG: sialate O-acetylesterase, partial [Rariglobus sp.]